jgi:surfeit locus 1 family protein
MWSVARRPRWIAALFLALGVAAAFAGLGQWQLERSFATGDIVTRETEVPVELEELAQPGVAVTAPQDGQLVTVAGEWVASDTLVVSERVNDGESGFWVVGHLTTAGGAGLAVAVGWTDSEQTATDARDAFIEAASDDPAAELGGRYVLGDAAHQTDFETGELSAVSPAAFVNLWSVVEDAGLFNGYLVSDAAAPGLEVISAPPPPEDIEINWLNIFYALEWAVFAGFALFLWWRLVKDAWEKETYEAQTAAAS